MILIGYWKNKHYYIDNNEILPDPSTLIDVEFWLNIGKKYNGLTKSQIVEYLDSNIDCNYYRGLSICRICDAGLSSYERHDGVYVWPDMLSHYIDKHDVILPDEFIQHIHSSILKNGIQKCTIKNYEHVIKDYTFWLKWSKTI